MIVADVTLKAPIAVVAPTVEWNVVVPLPVEMVKGLPAALANKFPQNVTLPPLVVIEIPVPTRVGDSVPEEPKVIPTPAVVILMGAPLLKLIKVCAHNVTLDVAALIVPLGTFKLPPEVQTAAAVRTVVLPAPALVIVMFAGSISHSPVKPRGEMVLTFPNTLKSYLPEVSTNPPFPPSKPPRA